MCSFWDWFFQVILVHLGWDVSIIYDCFNIFWRKPTPLDILAMSVYAPRRPSFGVCTYTVYLIGVYVCVCEGMCLCWCYPPSLPSHLFPQRLGLVVWTSEWGPLKQVSLLPVWLSEWVFSPYTFTLIMSVTLSLTSGALYVCHFFIILLLSQLRLACNMFTHCCLGISSLTF